MPVKIKKKHQDLIAGLKRNKSLDEIYNIFFTVRPNPSNKTLALLKEMTTEQIAAAYLEVAEVDFTPVSLLEAVEAYTNKKRIDIYKNNCIINSVHYDLVPFQITKDMFLTKDYEFFIRETY